ncbi:hypothetical protein DFJ73DRAFT_414832 [Zopfochytrium polystomum]|nr:hypothetical protein DFJ73DRAFT_414832 [Zopfochytrium polystomum]
MKSREQRVVFLTGKVILSLQKPLSNATELTLNTSGSSFVDVTHFNSIDSDTTFRPVSSTLLKNDAILWRRSELDAKDFPVGDHEWSFVLPLQSNLPPSIELRYGKIEYTIRARMSRKGLAPDVVSPILPINVVRTRPKGFPMREVVLKDPEGLFRMRLTLPAESFVGDESIAMSTELTPIHHDALGVLRSVKIFVREKQSFSCGFKDKNTMFKMETALGKGAKYSVDPSQRNITESLSPHGRHAEAGHGSSNI